MWQSKSRTPTHHVFAPRPDRASLQEAVQGRLRAMCSRYASKASTYTDDSLLASCRQVATLPSPAQSRHPENRKPKFYRLELAALQVTHISVLETGRLFVGLRETEGSQPLHADSWHETRMHLPITSPMEARPSCMTESKPRQLKNRVAPDPLCQAHSKKTSLTYTSLAPERGLTLNSTAGLCAAICTGLHDGGKLNISLPKKWLEKKPAGVTFAAHRSKLSHLGTRLTRLGRGKI